MHRTSDFETQRLGELAGLTAGLAQDARIRLRLGEHWSFNSLTRELTVATKTLRESGIDYCAGLIGHEVGHAWISRYGQFRPWPGVARPLRAHLLNALEDPRVEAWMTRRYPGLGVWLGAVQRQEVQDLATARLGDQPDVVGFCLACAYQPTHGWRSPPGLSTAVLEALDRTYAARQAYQALQPPTVPDDGPLDSADWALYRDRVWPDLLDASAAAGGAWSQRVLLSAWRGDALARAGILPTARALWDADRAHLSTVLGEDPLLSRQARDALARELADAVSRLLVKAFSARARSAAGRTPGAAGNARRAGVSARSVPGHDLAERLLQRLLRADARPGTGLLSAADGMLQLPPEPGREPVPNPLPNSARGSRTPSPAVASVSPTSNYDVILQRVGPHIDRLYAHFEDAVQPRRRLHETGGFPSGGRVDPRRVIAYMADRRRYDQLWVRRTLPDRRDLAVSLLVDLSGSMRDAKIAAALDGVVLLAETLHRLDVAVAINGFQDVLIPLCAFHEGLTAPVRERLLAMPLEVRGERPGGNNEYEHNDDGPCVRAAAEALLAQPASDRVLIVVSDGVPEGRFSDEQDLRRAIADIGNDGRVVVIGVGLGPRTEHVDRFYPRAIANVPVEQFADTLGHLLQRLLGGADEAMRAARG